MEQTQQTRCRYCQGALNAEQVRRGAAYCSAAHEDLYETLSRLGAVPQARGDVRDIPPDEPEAPEPSSQGGKTCRLCGKTLPFLVRLRGGEFCSGYHEREYQEKEAAVALTRVREYQRRGGSSGLRAEPGTVRVRNRGGAAALTPMRLPALALAVHWQGGAPGFELPGPADPVRLGPGRPQPVEEPLSCRASRCAGDGSFELAGATWDCSRRELALARAPRAGGDLWRYEQVPLGSDWLKRCEETADAVEAAWLAVGGEQALPEAAVDVREAAIVPARLVEPAPERAVSGLWRFESHPQYVSSDPVPADLVAAAPQPAGLPHQCSLPGPVEVVPVRAGHSGWPSDGPARSWQLSEAGGIGWELGAVDRSAAMARLIAETHLYPVAIARIGHDAWLRGRPAVLAGSTLDAAYPSWRVIAPNFAHAPAGMVGFDLPRQAHGGGRGAISDGFRSTEQARVWPAAGVTPVRAAVKRLHGIEFGPATRCDGTESSRSRQPGWAGGAAVTVTLETRSATVRDGSGKPGTTGWRSTAVPVAIRLTVWNAPATTAWAAWTETMAWIAAPLARVAAAPYGPPPRRIPFMDADEAAAGWTVTPTFAGWLGEVQPVAQPAPAAGDAPQWRRPLNGRPVDTVPARIQAGQWELKPARERLRLAAMRMQWPPDRREGAVGR